MKRIVEEQKREYYREQLSSPDVLPFMSLNSFSFVAESYPLCNCFGLASSADFPDLTEYLTVFESDREGVLSCAPSFSRPSFACMPSREDMLFVVPTLQHNSFLFMPIEEELDPRDSSLFEKSCESFLDYNECRAVPAEEMNKS